jgi:hypothetical protein
LHVLQNCSHLLCRVLQLLQPNVAAQQVQLLQQHFVLCADLSTISRATDELRKLQN